MWDAMRLRQNDERIFIISYGNTVVDKEGKGGGESYKGRRALEERGL